MSFLTERLFQVLDQHRIYEMMSSRSTLIHFMERHVICVWGYHRLLHSLQKDIIALSQPLNSDPYKEVIRLIHQIVLDEEVDQMGDGRITSHLELYLDAMEDIGCNLSPILTMFDLLENGIPAKKAIRSSGFPREAVTYGNFLIQAISRPLHERATVLFYEGEPFIPDAFLSKLESLSSFLEVDGFLDYMERHIEGLKKPGFSAAGRLVEVLCNSNIEMNDAAENIAEIVLRKRIDLWDAIADGLQEICPKVQIPQKVVTHLKLVT